MHCPEATSYLDMNVSNTNNHLRIITDNLLVHVLEVYVHWPSDFEKPMPRTFYPQRSMCPRDWVEHSREGSSQRRVLAQVARRTLKFSGLPYPYGCLGLLWLGYVVVRKRRDYTPSLASGQEPLCPAGSLRRAARSRAPVPGTARVHSSRSAAGICRQTLRRRPLLEYLCTDLMLAQRPRLATNWRERRS